MEFIELDRRFRPLEIEGSVEDAALNSYTRTTLGRDVGLGWNELLGERLVVVLGEPGSGKTREFKHRAQAQKDKGHYSFFVRLDELATQPLSAALGAEDKEDFDNWLRSEGEGTFFLDSVDEAKFRRVTEFYASLDRLRDGIGRERLIRVRLFLSSRISEWQPETDARELLQRFPSVTVLSERSSNHATDKESRRQEQLLVVQLEALDRSRIVRFVKGIGISEAEAFIRALDESHAWEFARRPIDVLDLASYWRAYGRLGSLTELIEYNIESNLRPSERDKNDPLSSRQAREGAEALGAATLLCRKFNFRVPDTGLATEALDAFTCLPEDWNKEQYRAFLARPLFDSASYGQIRFHHRRTAEYLAAKWFVRCMREGCSLPELEHLLSERFKDGRVLRGSLIPVSGWLCCGEEPWNHEVRQWVLEATPEVHLFYGDPSGLPLDYRRKILQGLVSRSEGKERVWIESSPESLARLADPALAGEISSIIRNQRISMDMREEMIGVVRYGHLEACLETLLELIASDEEPDDLKVYAVAAIRDSGDAESRRRLAGIVNQSPRMSNLVCARAIEALYPDAITVRDLVGLLKKADSEARYISNLSYSLRFHVESVLEQKDSGELLAGLIELGQTPPCIMHAGRPTKISARFHWTGDVIPIVLGKLLEKGELTREETEAAAMALWLLAHHRHYGRLQGDELQDLDAATSRHPLVRRAYVWHLVEEWDQTRKDQLLFFDQLFIYYEILKPHQSDLDWLVNDIKQQDDGRKSELALRFAVRLLKRGPRGRKDRRRVRAAVAHHANLRALYRDLRTDTRLMWFRRLWYSRIRYKVGSAHWWKQRFLRVRVRLRWIRDQWVLLSRLRSLASGKKVSWLSDLSREADENNLQRWAPISWEGLRKKRGRLITWAAKRGCKCAWRNYNPPLPHEKKTVSQYSAGVIVGLSGIQAAVLDGQLNLAGLASDEATLVARYAANELNGFPPWMNRLAEAQPEEVRNVLAECVRGEWKFEAEREDVYAVLYHLLWHGSGLVSLIEQDLLELLIAGAPPNISILQAALTILFGRDDSKWTSLAEIAAERIGKYAIGSHPFTLWLTVWLQIDAKSALLFLEQALANSKDGDRVILNLCLALEGDPVERVPRVPNPDYLTPLSLRVLIPLVYRHLRPEEDEQHVTDVYTPGPRDHAERFRGTLLDRLFNSESPDADAVLHELLGEPSMISRRELILHFLDERAKKRADLPLWEPRDVRTFAREFEIDPKTDRDLFKTVCRRLCDIRHDVEKADNSIRQDLHPSDDERRLRKWLARELSRRSRQRYTVPQEEEIDLQQRPDLRIENPKVRGPVSVEVKWADGESWTLRDLLERLENQLMGQYLRDDNARYGVYLLGNIGNKDYWINPADQRRVVFSEVLRIVEKRAHEIVAARPDVEDVAVIGIDFTDPRRQREH
jgi:hypothetical protein